MLVRKVKVGLGSRSYPIFIGSDLLPRVGEHCKDLGLGRQCAVISDSNVAPLHAPAVLQSLRAAGFTPLLITIKAGETSKNLRTVQSCYDALAQHRLERGSFVMALGGGVVGDLAGFVAATYLRGMAFVQAPTTLLSQVDSSVGGKVGVNLKAGKNLVGAFHQPRLVLCDLNALETLPEREFRSGLGEVIKYGIIYDAALFARLEKLMPKLLQRDLSALTAIIARCCEIKADVVGQDETESGLRAILNFGHTIGHAIEATAGYGCYLHGEAIAIGQVLAARLSSRILGLTQAEVSRIARLLELACLPVKIDLSAAARSRIIQAMRLDKKVSGGEVKFVLAKKIGRVEPGHRVSADLLEEILLQETQPSAKKPGKPISRK